jgi:hypothetical protein
VGKGRLKLEPDPDDADGQSLLLWYPTATVRTDDYIRSAVKIEAGAKSALDPHTAASVTPYIAADLPELDLRVDNVITVEAERTFWDKIIILHGLRQWHDRRGVLRHGGQRVSRHYYGVHQLMQSAHAAQCLGDRALAADCATHARLFFGGRDLGLTTAAHGTLTLTPTPGMHDALRADYAAMTGMIFRDVPPLDAVLATIGEIERRVNA